MFLNHYNFLYEGFYCINKRELKGTQNAVPTQYTTPDLWTGAFASQPTGQLFIRYYKRLINRHTAKIFLKNRIVGEYYRRYRAATTWKDKKTKTLKNKKL